MAGRSARPYGRDDTPSPDEVPDTPVPGQSHDLDFLLPMIRELQKSNAAVVQTIGHLAATIDKQGQKLDKLDDVKVELGKLQVEIAHLSRDHDITRGKLDKIDDSKIELGKLQIEIAHLIKDQASTKDKLDKVRTWVTGAAAVVGAIVIAVTVLARFFPVPAMPVQSMAAPQQFPAPAHN
jgi:hypothetical protein